jgi:hypothetical protein
VTASSTSVPESDNSHVPESDNSGASAGGRRRKRAAIIAVAVVAETIPLVRSGYGIGGNVVVRCSKGHLFTTIWLPGASVKSVRLGSRRFQYCPVGRHWTLVHLVRKSDLSARQLRAARKRPDIRIP